MTESEWLASMNVDAMLIYVKRTASDRKLRLFACACCYEIWEMLTDEHSCRAVKVTELYADELGTQEELKAARDAAWDAGDAAWAARATRAAWSAGAAGSTGAAMSAAWYAAWSAETAWTVARVKQADILRDICNPFWGSISPDVLTWGDSTIRKLARHIYAEKDWSTTPILADALEEAGCTDMGLLSHLRSQTSHWRGCWAVDLLTGRQT